VNRLSADTSYFTKYVLPVVMFLGVAAYMLWKEDQKSKPQFVILGVALLLLAGIYFAVLN
jgi:hypothetical protein